MDRDIIRSYYLNWPRTTSIRIIFSLRICGQSNLASLTWFARPGTRSPGPSLLSNKLHTLQTHLLRWKRETIGSLTSDLQVLQRRINELHANRHYSSSNYLHRSAGRGSLTGILQETPAIRDVLETAVTYPVAARGRPQL